MYLQEKFYTELDSDQCEQEDREKGKRVNNVNTGEINNDFKGK